MKEKVDIISLVIKIITIIVVLISIYMIILKLTNHSPALDTIIAGIIIAIVGVLFDIFKFRGKVENYIKSSDERFVRIETKIDRIELDATELKSDIKLIKHNLGIKA